MTSDRTAGNGLKLGQGFQVWIGCQEKVLYPESGWALEQVAEGSGTTTKPDGVQGVFGHCCDQARGGIVGAV